MIFRLCPILFVVFIIPLSVFAESDDTEKDKSTKTKRSILQRILPRTGDIEATVYQPDTDAPLVGAEIKITETGQSQKTGVCLSTHGKSAPDTQRIRRERSF